VSAVRSLSISSVPLLSGKLRRALRRKPLVIFSKEALQSLQTGESPIRMLRLYGKTFLESTVMHYVHAAGDNGFWEPRLHADRGRLNTASRNSLRARLSTAPIYRGEPRPSLAATVHFESHFPSVGYLNRLVSELGYDRRAADAAIIRAHIPWTRPKSDRKKGGVPYLDANHLYYPMSPQLHTTAGGVFRKERVTEAISRHRWDDKHSTAVFEVVYLRRKPFLVAASLGLRVSTVYNYCTRIRRNLREGMS